MSDHTDHTRALGELGNTRTNSPTREEKRSRAWVIVINNWTEEEYDHMVTLVSKKKWTYIIGKEIGKKNGTPHLQCYIRSKNAVGSKFLKKMFPRAHLEPAGGNDQHNLRYCSKDNEFITNIEKVLTPEEEYEEFMKEEYNEVKWYDWQENILKLVEEKPDKRKVYWFYEEDGNVGKSFLARYLDWKYDAIIANGKQQDVFNQYKMYLEEKKKQPKLAIIDVPRSHQNYICYSTFEKIKDGLFYSGKYEGGKLRLTPHHLIIFANFEPDISKMSEDRWEITHIR